MGTEIKVLFPFQISDFLFLELKKIFAQMEKKYSRFDSNSELSKLNLEKKIKLDQEFLEIIKLCKKIYNETNKAFNPLLSVKNLWYKENYKNPSKINEKKYNIDFNSIEIENWILKLKDDQELDLWWIVKGFTVDKASKFLLENWIKDFLINAGWDIFASGKANKNGKWKIEVEKTWQIIELSNKAVASSWKTKRFWKWSDWNLYHHILNVFTKKSSENDLASISVVANSCAEADAWATASFSLGEIQWQNLLIDNWKKYYLNLW